MIRRLAVVILLFAAVPAHAGFDEALGELRVKLGHTMWIPFFGLIRTVVRVGHPSGLHDLQLAVFEGKGRLDTTYLDRVMSIGARGGYTPLVRARERNEASFIYAKPIGDKVDLLVLTNDGDDTVLVRVVVNPEAVSSYIKSDPRHVGEIARH